MAVTKLFQVLLVCTANECRSVYAAKVLSDQPWRVVGAGTEASPGSSACALVGVDSHFSRLADSQVAGDSDLVLVMEKAHRSRIAELAPIARSRTFTLPEAARLSEAVADAIAGSAVEGSDFTSELPADWAKRSIAARLTWLVGEMNEARAFLEPRVEDIPDAHGDGARPHPQVFSMVDASTARLTAAIERVLMGQRG